MTMDQRERECGEGGEGKRRKCRTMNFKAPRGPQGTAHAAQWGRGRTGRKCGGALCPYRTELRFSLGRLIPKNVLHRPIPIVAVLQSLLKLMRQESA